MSTVEESGTRFAGDVAQHEMVVIQDDDVARHLRFQQPGTWMYGFDIHTVGGMLVFTGDMQTFVFSVGENPMAFFRQPKPNFGYWSSKLIACPLGGYETFSPERAKRYVSETGAEWLNDYEDDDPEREQLAGALAELVSHVDVEDESTFRERLDEFDIVGHRFWDWWEADFTELTYQLAWCLRAIHWAVGVYDTHKGA